MLDPGVVTRLAAEHDVGIIERHRRLDEQIRAAEQATALVGLVEQQAIDPAHRANVLLRVVDDAVWPFAVGQRHVGALVAAVDIAGDPVDDRAVEIAGPVIDAVLAP